MRRLKIGGGLVFPSINRAVCKQKLIRGSSFSQAVQ